VDTESLKEQIFRMGKQGKDAARAMAKASPEIKIAALMYLADLLRAQEREIIKANELDLEKGRLANIDAPRMDRLSLTPTIINEMADACEFVANLPDPVGAIDEQWIRPNGISVGRMRISLGLIAMIYESRPNVTIDAAILCLKAGNAVILRGGSEAYHSNMILAKLLEKSLEHVGLPAHAVQLVPVTDREAIWHICALREYVDVLIPRGGEDLVREVSVRATMPVLMHEKGVPHIFVDESADLAKALEIVYNSKVQRPGVCNALEGLLVHASVAEEFLPKIASYLGGAGVSFRACPKSLPLLLGDTSSLDSLAIRTVPMQESDKGTEFHDLVLAVSVVQDLDDALNYIHKYGSRHTEIICSNNAYHVQRFLREADASMVGHNVSTRFNDGSQLGLGAEIGISTSKLHSYGPMGVEQLTTTKFVVMGNGQVRK